MGNRYEQKFVTAIGLLDEWAVITAPASGSSTKRHLPDMAFGRPYSYSDGVGPLIGNAAEVVGVEHKSASDYSVHFDQDEVEDELVPWCEAFGARPALAARFTTQDTSTYHFLIDPEDAKRTDSGNYTIPASEARERAFAVVHEDGTVEWLDPAVVS